MPRPEPIFVCGEWPKRSVLTRSKAPPLAKYSSSEGSTPYLFMSAAGKLSGLRMYSNARRTQSSLQGCTLWIFVPFWLTSLSFNCHLEAHIAFT